jgi:hypothetical protein
VIAPRNVPTIQPHAITAATSKRRRTAGETRPCA